MGQPPTVFETVASTFPPLRHPQAPSILDNTRSVKFALPKGVMQHCPSMPDLMMHPFARLARLPLWGWVGALTSWAGRLFVGGIRLSFATSGEWGSRSPRQVPPRRSDFDEQALLAAAQRGSLPAFNQLVLHYQGLAYNIAYRMLGDTDSASDATQDAFVKAFQKLDQYRGGSFKAWLLRILTNTCYDALRARKRRPTSSLEQEEEDDPEYDGRLLDTTERPDAYVMRQELAGAIQVAIEQLPSDQRAILVLADIEGLDYQEIAYATGVALGTVKSRLSRARAKMRDMLLAQKELLPAQYRLTDSLE